MDEKYIGKGNNKITICIEFYIFQKLFIYNISFESCNNPIKGMKVSILPFKHEKKEIHPVKWLILDKSTNKRRGDIPRFLYLLKMGFPFSTNIFQNVPLLSCLRYVLDGEESVGKNYQGLARDLKRSYQKENHRELWTFQVKCVTQLSIISNMV